MIIIFQLGPKKNQSHFMLFSLFCYTFKCFFPIYPPLLCCVLDKSCLSVFFSGNRVDRFCLILLAVINDMVLHVLYKHITCVHDTYLFIWCKNKKNIKRNDKYHETLVMTIIYRFIAIIQIFTSKIIEIFCLFKIRPHSLRLG